MYLLRMCRHRHKSRQTWCRVPEIGHSRSSLERYLVLCMTHTDDVALLELQVAVLLIYTFALSLKIHLRFRGSFCAFIACPLPASVGSNPTIQLSRYPWHFCPHTQ